MSAIWLAPALNNLTVVRIKIYLTYTESLPALSATRRVAILDSNCQYKSGRTGANAPRFMEDNDESITIRTI
ncbi:hypothetical protein Pan153_02480 [Gimesia panareensis]|uniref:Uncharacterized protein n=1 Tax=Gimesia panareensis TaxID=2527978 RepID=A0A518FH19_9PLAN|nr:hypothetical protein Pan153_02480 [Gimesia panareensis]